MATTHARTIPVNDTVPIFTDIQTDRLQIRWMLTSGFWIFRNLLWSLPEYVNQKHRSYHTEGMRFLR